MLRSPPLKIGRWTISLPVETAAGLQLAAELAKKKPMQKKLAQIVAADVALAVWAALAQTKVAKDLSTLFRGKKWSAAPFSPRQATAWRVFCKNAKKAIKAGEGNQLRALLHAQAPQLADTKTSLSRGSKKADASSVALAQLLSSLPFAPSPLRPLAPASLEAAKQRALYNFAYGLSHEINNPLANISLRAQMLSADEKDPEKRRKLGVIHAQAMRAYEMIADLMLYAHPPAPKFETLELAALITSAVDDMQDAAAGQQTALKIENLSPAKITADAVQIRTLIRSLMQNGLEALRHGGQITVAGNRAGGKIAFTITDTGAGIPKLALPHVFDPFYSGREAGRGLGLGLSKCWRIVELHNGKISIKNRAPGGVQVRVELPPG